MTMKNGHDVNFHILHPIDDGICHAKLIDVHLSNISCHQLLVEMFNRISVMVISDQSLVQWLRSQNSLGRYWFEIGVYSFSHEPVRIR